MAAPTLVAVYGVPTPSSSQVTTGQSVVATSTVTATWAIGDLLVAIFDGDSASATITLSTPTATGITFSQLARLDGSASGPLLGMWSGTATAAGTGAAISFTESSASSHALIVYRFSAASGVGTAVSRFNNSASTDTNGPTVAITTVQDNSMIIYSGADWAAVSQASPTFSTATAGTATIEHNLTVSGTWTDYDVIYQNAGTAGAKTVGLTSGTNMRLSTVAVEVKGITGSPVPERVPPNPARFRASGW